MKTRPTIGPGVARAMVALSVERGLDPGPLLAILATTAARLDAPETKLDFEAFASGWAWLARATGDESVSFAVAKMLRIEIYDVMGFACMTAPTARDAIERLCRFQRLFTDGGVLSLDTAGDEPRLLWLREGPLDLGHRLVDESVLASALGHYQQVTAHSLRVTRVFFRHPAPREADHQRRLFSAPITYGSQVCGIAFAPFCLDVIPRLADASLAEHFANQGEKALAATLRPPTLAARVREALLREMASGLPSQGVVARRLGMSERTLRRRLADEHVVFGALADELRASRARALIADARVSVNEAAFALGFSDASTFARAFRRWHGIAHRAYQRGGGVPPPIPTREAPNAIAAVRTRSR